MVPLKFDVWRRWLFANESIGKLYESGLFTQIYTLEDEIRPPGEKVPGETAIPYGKYPLDITWSNRFERLMPLIENVPGFTGIRIHDGINERYTDGCLLVGTGLKGKTLTGGKEAFNFVYSEIEKAKNAGRKMFIEFLSTEHWLIKRVVIFLSLILLAVIIALIYFKYFAK